MVERVKQLLEKAREYPVTTVRYILVVAGILATFNNIFDCITKGVTFEVYFLYVGVLGAITLALIFISRNAVVCFVLAMAGMMMIYDTSAYDSISGGVAFMLFAKRIANNLIFSFFIYAITVIMVVANHTFRGATPADSVNVIIGYFAIYLVDYILEGVQKRL